MRIVVPPGVFAPISDSIMLAEAVEREAMPAGARLLDLCTGSGVVAVRGARRGARATAVDVSWRAVLTARVNARLNGVRVRGVRGSLFEAVDAERFDCIAANPPYVPSTSDALPARGPSRAWEAGADGRVPLDRICREAPGHLNPGGVLLVVHSTVIDEGRTLGLLAGGGLDVDVVERRRGPLGPLMRRCVRDGRLPAGLDEEEVVVVRAQRSSGNSAKIVPPGLRRAGVPA